MIPEVAAVMASRAARSFVRAHYIIVVQAKNRETNAVERMALWDGDDTRIMEIPGFGNMTVYGSGRILNLPNFSYEVGLDAKTYEVGLSQVDDAVQQLVRGYDPRLAPVYIYRVEYGTNGKPLAAPRRIFKGFIDGTPIDTPAADGEGGVTLRISSDAKKLTHYGSAMKNDAFQRKRSNDPFRSYSSVSVETVPWGRKMANTRKPNPLNPRGY